MARTPARSPTSRNLQIVTRVVLCVLPCVAACYDASGPSPDREYVEAKLKEDSTIPMTMGDLTDIIVGNWRGATVDASHDEVAYTFNSDRTYSVECTKVGDNFAGKVGLAAFSLVGLSGAEGTWLIQEVGSDVYLILAVGEISGAIADATMKTIAEEEMARAGVKWRVRRIGLNDLVMFSEDDKPKYRFTRLGPTLVR